MYSLSSASRLTLDVIGPAAMGRDFRSLHNPENKVADSFLAILEPTKEKMAFLAINFILPQWFARRLPWRLNKVIDTETGFLRDLCKDIVREKRKTIVSSNMTAKELEADILGTMMVGGDFTDDELVDQMLTFLAAGVCSSSTHFGEHPTNVNSMRRPPAHSPGPATFSPSTPTFKSVCARRSVSTSRPVTTLSPGATLNQCRYSTASARKSCVCIPPSPSRSAKPSAIPP